MTVSNDHDPGGVAIVGMAGRFPGANNVSTFWENIKGGVESVTHFSKDELAIVPQGAEDDDAGDYVCAKGMLDDIDLFDARFFGYLPREAEVMDPQHRIFLEICWEAMEHSGHDPARYPGAVGVFGGCYMDTYVLWNLCSDEKFRERLVESIQVGSLQTELGNDKDYLATRVAYKLGLRGPAMTLQTACSTSLVAIATACQSIESYQCDMALAGGVTIILPQHKGYFYKEGGMLSPDGHCRTFDENAAGTVFSHGAAVLVLKRYEDALADNDTIYSVIRGYATNNDGGEKVSYTAPSVAGQAEVISLALGMGGIDARSIGLVEAHGTATPLGDPIEVAGLTAAYKTMTDDTQFCAIGSVKANLGHLDVASGAIGLIKTSLALHEKVMPPQINFEKPNPKIDFASTPFFVNTKLCDWGKSEFPRRAGVSSFGVGGTNAHVVVEEAPASIDDPTSRNKHLLVLSARTPDALDAQAENLASHIEHSQTSNIADVAHTLAIGRREYDFRRAIVVSDENAAETLRKRAKPGLSGKAISTQPDIIFMYPGQGVQYPGMGRALYHAEPVFRETIDTVASVLLQQNEFGADIRKFLLWSEESEEAAGEIAAALSQTAIAQPALFAIETALGRLFGSWGYNPSGVIGHSIGEFAAAVDAGVFSLEDATRLVAARGRLMQAQPPGRMLAVLAPRGDVGPLLTGDLCIAAVNAPNVTVVSGPADEIETFGELLETKDVGAKALHTSHAFHSSMMHEARAPLEAQIEKMATQSSAIDIYSTLTGGKIDQERWRQGDYWGTQLMQPVLFADAASAAAVDGANRIFIEVGPGQSLGAAARQTLTDDLERPLISCLGPANGPGDDVENILGAVGQLWVNGAAPDWSAFTVGKRRRVALPTYPFERKRYWVEPAKRSETNEATTAKSNEIAKEDVNAETNTDDLESLIEKQLGVIHTQLQMLKSS